MPHHTNALAGETSPYLLQHAHNPVDWKPWGPAAFAEARERNEGTPHDAAKQRQNQKRGKTRLIQ